MAGALEVIQVVAEFIYLGQQIMNVYHAVSPSATADNEVVEDLTIKIDEAMTELQAELDGSLAGVSLRVINLSDNAELDLVSWPTFVGGAVGGAVGLPPGVAALVTFPTAALGVRGRKFICGASEAQNSDGVWEASFIASLESYASMIANPFPGDSSLNIWQFGTYNPTTGFNPFTGWQVGNVPAYQRRRKQGVGA